MTCKDCIHYEVCAEPLNDDWSVGRGKIEIRCENFADKSRFIELPCRVGDTVYSICGGLRDNKKVVVDTVICFNIYDGLTMDTLWLSLGKLGVNVFITKEEAEKALKEREKNDI